MLPIIPVIRIGSWTVEPLTMLQLI
ncbi:hypothetical protein Pint_07564 [Pistacia integerrima]|uniref:Uncharacterized protein n=1 Tax=Pistacia integerrima TaxID=434235 RepID=A0ACC0XVD9_9ROSI|nr:hypothetical protein Pint_07564 [Pistacia integerrima]